MREVAAKIGGRFILTQQRRLVHGQRSYCLYIREWQIISHSIVHTTDCLRSCSLQQSQLFADLQTADGTAQHVLVRKARQYCPTLVILSFAVLLICCLRLQGAQARAQ